MYRRNSDTTHLEAVLADSQAANETPVLARGTSPQCGHLDLLDGSGWGRGTRGRVGREVRDGEAGHGDVLALPSVLGSRRRLLRVDDELRHKVEPDSHQPALPEHQLRKMRKS